MIIPAHHAAGLLTMLRIDPSIVSPNMDGSGTTCSTVSCACPALYSNPVKPCVVHFWSVMPCTSRGCSVCAFSYGEKIA